MSYVGTVQPNDVAEKNGASTSKPQQCPRCFTRYKEQALSPASKPKRPRKAADATQGLEDSQSMGSFWFPNVLRALEHRARQNPVEVLNPKP